MWFACFGLPIVAVCLVCEMPTKKDIPMCSSRLCFSCDFMCDVLQGNVSFRLYVVCFYQLPKVIATIFT